MTPTKLELEIKSRFGKSRNISKTSLNTEQLSLMLIHGSR